MRHASRLLARYLEPGVPTGLTGLWTHATPRSALLSIYKTTLAKLQRFPESSLYRQSIESLTKHRLALVENTVPAGYEEWVTRTQKLITENPQHFRLVENTTGGLGPRTFHLGGQTFVIPQRRVQNDIREEEWNGEVDDGPLLEGQRAAEEKPGLVSGETNGDLPGHVEAHLSSEPQLTVSQ